MSVEFDTVQSLFKSVYDGIKCAEKVFPGAGRGKEKRAGALNVIESELREVAEAVSQIKSTEWLGIAVDSPDLRDKFGALVDSIVDLKNFFSTFDGIPEDPKVVN